MRGPLLVLLSRDDFARELYTDSLVGQGFRVRAETELEEALAALRKGAQLLIASVSPGSIAVAELVAQVRRAAPLVPVMAILSRDAAEEPLRALRDGALEALQAPVSPEALGLAVTRCLDTVALFEREPDLLRHVELFHATQRLTRAGEVPALARELLDAATVRLPSAGLVVAGGGIVAARGLHDEELRELTRVWDTAGLAQAEPILPAPPSEGGPKPGRAARRERFEDRVVGFPAEGGPLARAAGGIARLVPGLVALRVGPTGHERMWVLLLPPPRARRELRAVEPELCRDLGILAMQATLALEAAIRFPDGDLEAAIDPLTDLMDERSFQRTLDHEIRRHEHSDGQTIGMLIVWLEGPPQLREADEGFIEDRLLVESARVLVRAVREQDMVARTGPRQFGVLLLGTNLDGAQRTAERVRRAFEGHRFLAREGLDLRLTVAVGVAAYPQHGGSALEMRDVAEQAARASGVT